MGEGIGWAIKQLRNGQKVCRDGWKDTWLILIPEMPQGAFREGSPYAKALGDRPGTIIRAHIDMRTADGQMQPGWLASQADLLADDWQVFQAQPQPQPGPVSAPPPEGIPSDFVPPETVPPPTTPGVPPQPPKWVQPGTPTPVGDKLAPRSQSPLDMTPG
jgi:hypothetical protein